MIKTFLFQNNLLNSFSALNHLKIKIKNGFVWDFFLSVKKIKYTISCLTNFELSSAKFQFEVV